MEITLAILMVVGIYVGIPVALVAAIGGVHAIGKRLAHRAEGAQTFAEAGTRA